ncbi:MAG: DUF5069 domain-containing protein [Verrucomicrobiota bacterium]
MEKIVPTISSGTIGPLGVMHLPRLWQKTLLSACGRLPEGYKDVKPGFDYMCLEGIGIDPESARNYIFSEKPSYLQFEAWVMAQPGANVSPENIARVNAVIVARQKSPESQVKMLKQNGLPEDTPISDSIMLNQLDDWRELYAQLGLAK